MSANFDTIFNQILQSEINATDKKRRLVEVKKQIEDIVNCIKNIEDELVSLEGQKFIKIQKACEEELNHQWNLKHYDVMKIQEAAIKNEELQLNTKLIEAENQDSQLQQIFSESVEKFSQHYFAFGTGWNKTELMLKRKQEDFKEIKIHLQTQMEMAKKIKELKLIEFSLRKELQQHKLNILNLKEQLRKEESDLANLRQKKLVTENILTQDPTFERENGYFVLLFFRLRKNCVVVNQMAYTDVVES